jgi:hypothetical protein
MNLAMMFRHNVPPRLNNGLGYRPDNFRGMIGGTSMMAKGNFKIKGGIIGKGIDDDDEKITVPELWDYINKIKGFDDQTPYIKEIIDEIGDVKHLKELLKSDNPFDTTKGNNTFKKLIDISVKEIKNERGLEKGQMGEEDIDVKDIEDIGLEKRLTKNKAIYQKNYNKIMSDDSLDDLEKLDTWNEYVKKNHIETFGGSGTEFEDFYVAKENEKTDGVKYTRTEDIKEIANNKFCVYDVEKQILQDPKLVDYDELKNYDTDNFRVDFGRGKQYEKVYTNPISGKELTFFEWIKLKEPDKRGYATKIKESDSKGVLMTASKMEGNKDFKPLFRLDNGLYNLYNIYSTVQQQVGRNLKDIGFINKGEKGRVNFIINSPNGVYKSNLNDMIGTKEKSLFVPVESDIKGRSGETLYTLKIKPELMKGYPNPEDYGFSNGKWESRVNSIEYKKDLNIFTDEYKKGIITDCYIPWNNFKKTKI